VLAAQVKELLPYVLDMGGGTATAASACSRNMRAGGGQGRQDEWAQASANTGGMSIGSMLGDRAHRTGSCAFDHNNISRVGPRVSQSNDIATAHVNCCLGASQSQLEEHVHRALEVGWLFGMSGEFAVWESRGC
jgi:hypothetical protein